MQSILIIGAGQFGTRLALRLTQLQNEVMLVDKDEKALLGLESAVTRVQIGDCMEKVVLEELGVRNFDLCFVCVSNDFQASMEITSMLKELGAPWVVSKADHDIHADLLKKIGADEVIFPEVEMAERAAIRYSDNGIFDYFEISRDFAIMEVVVPLQWEEHSVQEMDVRRKYHVNVIGMKQGQQFTPLNDAGYIFQKEEHLIVAGKKTDIEHMIRHGV